MMVVICIGGGRQAHEDEERDSCIHFTGLERDSLNQVGDGKTQP